MRSKTHSHCTNIPYFKHTFHTHNLKVRQKESACLISRQLTYFMVDIELRLIIYSLLQIMPQKGFR